MKGRELLCWIHDIREHIELRQRNTLKENVQVSQMNEIVIKLLIVCHSDQTEMLTLLLDSMNNIEILATVSTANDYIDTLTQNSDINAVLLHDELNSEIRGLEAYNLLRLRGRHVPTILLTESIISASHIADLEITDILQMPFTWERLKLGIEKQRKQIQFMNSGGLLVPVISDQIRLFTPEDILFIESINRVVCVHTKSDVLKSTIPIKVYERYLLYNDFVLTHRSCIINLHHVDRVQDNEIFFKESKHSTFITDDKKSSFIKQLSIFINKRA
ncbi:Sensory transduction protein LytR [compost metagenome]